MKACKAKAVKVKAIKKHLKEDIKEAHESISEDKSLMKKIKNKAISGIKRSHVLSSKSAKKAKSK